MKRPTKTIDNKRDFWVKLCNHNPQLADKKLRQSKNVKHKYLKA